MTATHDTKRIAKNTFIMYIRMFVMMLIGLYTSRVILNTLGVEDYGVYNVVGGVVAMFSIISSSLSGSVSRFLTFEIGRGDMRRLKEIFSTSIIVQTAMAVGIVVVMEFVGVWFLNHKMNIPPGRMVAANFVLQCSIVSFALGLINTPFSALIVAHERFGIFAYLTLSDSILKLLVVYLLYISPFDKLQTYAILLLAVTVLVQIVYFVYCRRQFEECRFSWIYKKTMLKEMGGFAGWTFLGNGSYILMTQGVNILMNLFFGVVVNAARGVATIVENILTQFVNNFVTAINPQITKSYASEDKEYLVSLINVGSKFSYLLLFAIAFPVFLEAENLLKLWLVTVPPFTVLFLRLTIISILVTVLSNTMVTALLATGQIKSYQITIGAVSMMVLPVSYLLYKIGFPAYVSYVIQIIVMLYQLSVRLHFLKKHLEFNIKKYLSVVVLRLLLMTVVSIMAVPFMSLLFIQNGLLEVLIKCILAVFVSLFASYGLALTKGERIYVKSIIRTRLLHDKNSN